jgi:hypothetical protein
MQPTDIGEIFVMGILKSGEFLNPPGREPQLENQAAGVGGNLFFSI